MQLIIDLYEDRTKEIELYFSALNQLYEAQNNPETQNNQDAQNSQDAIAYDFYNDDFLKILKSNALLMVYNLVESTIMGGILEIYEKFKANGCSYKDVREEIQSIWFSFKFNQVYDKSAHYNSYKEKALEIINGILSNEVIELSRKATDISGNLDADKIRQICSDHGIDYSVDRSCNGGVLLADVKNKRNELAHGTTSFVECGRDYTIDDLTKIKKQTVKFLEGILNGMKDYYDQELYKKSVV